MRSLLLSFVFSLFCVAAHANMIVGADITYVGLGQSKYRVNLRLIKDCTYNFEKDTETVYITSPTSASLDSIRIGLKKRRVIGDYYCTGKTICEGGINPGFQELIYSGVVDLTMNLNCEIVFSYQGGTRPNGLTNATTGSTLYINSSLNKCLAPNNSSPVFTVDPRLFSNVSRDEEFSVGMADTIDNDLVIASLGLPKNDVSTNMTYQVGYGPDKPLFFLGYPVARQALPRGFHLDSLRGTYKFRSLGDGAFVMNVSLQEYRNVGSASSTPVKIGEVNREWILFIRTNFSSRNPQLSVPDEIVVCPGKQNCFDVTSSDADFDSTFLQWSYNVTGAIQSTSTKTEKNASASFCWSPSAADISQVPYLVTIEARDNRCEYNGYSSKTVLVKVLGDTNLQAKIIKSVDNCGQYTYRPMVINGTAPYQYKWTGEDGILSTDSVILHKYRKKGTYDIKLEVTSSMGCSYVVVQDSVVIPNDYNFSVSLGPDFSVCKGSTINLHATVSGNNGPYSISWVGYPDTIPDLVSIGHNPSQYIVLAKNQDGCIESDTIMVNLLPSTPVNAGTSPQNACIFDNPITLAGTPAGGNWSGSGVIGNVFDPSKAGLGTHDIVYTVLGSNGCDNRDTIHYIVVSNPNVDAGPDTTLCVNSGLYTLSNGYPLGGTWIGPWVSGNLFDPFASGAGEFTIFYNHFNAGGCGGFDSVKIIVRDTLPWLDMISMDQQVCKNGPAVTLEALPTGGIWSGAGVIGNKFFPATAGVGEHNITYTVGHPNGCKTDSTIKIKVHDVPAINAGTYPDVCANNNPILLQGSPEGGYWTGTGVAFNSFDGQYYFHPNIAGIGNQQLFYHLSNPGCTVSDTATILVNPVPVPVINADNVYGPAPLTVNFKDLNSTSTYWAWSFGDTTAGMLNYSFVKAPTFTYNNPGTYLVSLNAGRNSCFTRKPTTMTIVVTLPSSVMEDLERSGMSVYPNPSNGNFEIRLQSGNIAVWSITDLSGRLIQTVPINNPSNEEQIRLDNLSTGIYLLQVKDDAGKVYQQKISIQQ